jgi:hypothetical protein
MKGPSDKPVVIPFPARPAKAPRNLGLTPLSKSLGPMPNSPKGHWCSTCQGIWYSYVGEARCPVCGGKA